MSHRIEPLADGHRLNAFTCGHPDLDQWLHLHAAQATRQGTRTYLLVEGDSGAVIGYFAIAPHILARDEAPRQIGRGAPRAIPAILLAKLALDSRFQGQGLGDELLVYALTKIVTAARAAGGKLVVVDAIDETAASFYRTHSFQPSPADPLRLVMKLSTVARELELPWP